MHGTAVDSNDARVRDRLYAADAAALGPAVEGWQSAAEIAGRRRVDLAEQFDWCTDRKIATIRAEALGLATPDDYLQRVIEVDGAIGLVGIRFLGGDRTKPFVELIAVDGAGGAASATSDVAGPLAPAPLEALSRAALQVYAVFGPVAVRHWCGGADERPPLPADRARTWVDQVFVAGPPSEMLAAAEAPASVWLVDAAPDAAMAFIDREYAAFARRAPELAPRVPPSDLGDCHDCRRRGHLAWWTVGGRVAGLIAVERRSYAGLDGWLMVEELVGEAFAGRGSAAAAQWRMAERLRGHEMISGDASVDASVGASDERLVVHGTIDGRNHSSRRTAARAGRRTIGAWWFIEPVR